MELSAEHFERIVSALRSDGSCGSAREKRRNPRVGLRATVTIVQHNAAGTSTRTTSILRDVSREGIGIQHCREIKAGQRFLVQFPGKGGAIQSYLCTARRCHPVTKDCLDAFHIGATFVRACNFSAKDAGKTSGARSARGREPAAQTKLG